MCCRGTRARRSTRGTDRRTPRRLEHVARFPGAGRRHRRARKRVTPPMDHQLIIKFWRASLEDEAFLATIEADLAQVLADGATTDGFDTTTKEINLFILTADPRGAFRRVKPVLEGHRVLHAVSAGYRLVGGARFTSVWPMRAMRKFKL